MKPIKLDFGRRLRNPNEAAFFFYVKGYWNKRKKQIKLDLSRTESDAEGRKVLFHEIGHALHDTPALSKKRLPAWFEVSPARHKIALLVKYAPKELLNDRKKTVALTEGLAFFLGAKVAAKTGYTADAKEQRKEVAQWWKTKRGALVRKSKTGKKVYKKK